MRRRVVGLTAAIVVGGLIVWLALAATTAGHRHGTSKPLAGSAPPRASDGYKTVGKFFIQFGSIKVNCTATVIGSDTIVTAAHCFKGRLGATKYTTTGWMFAPMWHNNKFPYGKWSVRSVYLTRSWISKLDTSADYAVVVLNPRNGHDVGFYTGQDSWSSSLSLVPGQSTPVRIVGIPQTSQNPLTSVTSAVATTVGRGFEALRASTPGFSDGTSGGPWFSPFDPTTGIGTIIGVTGGYQAGGNTDSPSYADLLSRQFADLMAAAVKGITHCDRNGDCRFWP